MQTCIFMDDVARAVEKTGIRANLSRGLVSGEDSDKKLDEAIKLIEDWAKKAQGRITVNLAPTRLTHVILNS